MSSSRLKSIIIVVLLLINLFFLTDIVTNNVRLARERSDTIDSIASVMKASGISFAEDAIGDISVLETYTTSQDAFADALIARTILGDCEPVLTDSGQWYTGSRGSAFFNTSGVMIIELTEHYVPTGSTTVRAVKKLLRNMSIDATEPVVTVFGETEILTVLCTLRGNRIFNCTVTFEFRNGALINVTGRRPSGLSESSGGSSVSFSTAALSFVRYVRDNNLEIDEITSVEPGYRMSAGAFGDGELLPGWLIVTGAGSYFAEASTGEIIRNDA